VSEGATLSTPITKLLVANRGEIASRIMRTARQLDIATVAVFSDADAEAPFVAQADEAVRLPGHSATDTYLRADLLVAAARTTGADAVHPGYGFLSERAEFAEACVDAGLVFVGPPPDVIEAMGSKIGAKEMMAAAGVPVLPGTTVGDDLEAAARAADEIGLPLLVKASHGGGGRGIRVVEHPSGLLDAVHAARREAAASSGGSEVFLERYVTSPRHVEIQIVGDVHGNVAHLFERECSIQRRFQKVVEEAPSPAVDPALRTLMGEAAVAAAKAIGYVGAGTVEFLVDPERRFYFLEVNARLQVEHPVTEMVTGLDLVRLQLLVAEGHPLPSDVLGASLSGHAVEARLYAEDVPAGFLPATGRVHRFSVPAAPGLRVDTGVDDGSSVSAHYDPLLAKVIAHAATRQEACRRLAAVLDDALLHGPVTNRDLLVGILRDPDFRSGHFDTAYFDGHDPAQLSRSRHHEGASEIHALAAALAGQEERRAAAPVLESIPSGWRNVANAPQSTTYSSADGRLEVRYRIRASRSGRAVEAEVNGRGLGEVALRVSSGRRVDLELDGVRRIVSVHRVGNVSYVDSALGSCELVEEPRFPEPSDLETPGSLLASLPGTVVRTDVRPGDHVEAGTIVVVIEAMKMEQPVRAPRRGTVKEVAVSAGQVVDVGTVLAVIEESAAAEEAEA